MVADGFDQNCCDYGQLQREERKGQDVHVSMDRVCRLRVPAKMLSGNHATFTRRSVKLPGAREIHVFLLNARTKFEAVFGRI